MEGNNFGLQVQKFRDTLVGNVLDALRDLRFLMTTAIKDAAHHRLFTLPWTDFLSRSPIRYAHRHQITQSSIK